MRLAAVVAAALALAAGALGAGATLYSAPATQACLLHQRGAIAGLPPATPPAAVVFVHRSGLLQPPAVAQVGVWTGPAGATISFFGNARSARSSRQRGDLLAGNVVVEWDHAPARFRASVRGCLKAAGWSPASTHTAPPATLATFAGEWGGHTRGLFIGATGRGDESVDDGCCTRVYRMTFRILAVNGTLTHATATFRVLSYKHYPEGPRVRVGAVGKLLLRNGIVTNTLTGVYFCSDPAWGATGACGA
jgi:hypothetical protein